QGTCRFPCQIPTSEAACAKTGGGTSIRFCAALLRCGGVRWRARYGRRRIPEIRGRAGRKRFRSGSAEPPKRRSFRLAFEAERRARQARSEEHTSELQSR